MSEWHGHGVRHQTLSTRFWRWFGKWSSSPSFSTTHRLLVVSEKFLLLFKILMVSCLPQVPCNILIKHPASSWIRSSTPHLPMSKSLSVAMENRLSCLDRSLLLNVTPVEIRTWELERGRLRLRKEQAHTGKSF